MDISSIVKVIVIAAVLCVCVTASGATTTQVGSAIERLR
jgi:hypothetical protein